MTSWTDQFVVLRRKGDTINTKQLRVTFKDQYYENVYYTANFLVGYEARFVDLVIELQLRFQVINLHELCCFVNGHQKFNLQEYIRDWGFVYICFSKNIPDECPICMDTISECETFVTKCHHIFHRHCLEKWEDCNSSRFTCPICRISLLK